MAKCPADSLFLSSTENANNSTVDQVGNRANDLGGKDWTKNSISIWSDIKKDSEELQLGHPAIYPKALVRRLLESFTCKDERNVLDPFAGSGSTLLAAMQLGKHGIGFEINDDYISLANDRKNSTLGLFDSENSGSLEIHKLDSRELLQVVMPSSIDICITSPPYWNILTQKRSADNKSIRNYGDDEKDLGRISDYKQFIHSLVDIFSAVLASLKPRGYCLINVMDIRKGPIFYPFHSDLAESLRQIGFIWDDMIIWDRRAEYNNLRPLGYPSVFRINKAHEYILILQKPR